MYIFRSSECTVKEIELVTPCSQIIVLFSKEYGLNKSLKLNGTSYGLGCRVVYTYIIIFYANFAKH